MRKLFINTFTESLLLCLLAAVVACLYLIVLPWLYTEGDIFFYIGAVILVFGPFVVREIVSKIVEYFIEK